MERNIIKIDEEGLKNDLKGVIRKTIEETLNTMLDEEAAELCNAERQERTDERKKQLRQPLSSVTDVVESASEVFLDAKRQRCAVHFFRNLMMKIPRNKLGTVMPLLQGDIRLGRQGCGTEEGACRGKEALRHGSEICLGAVRQGCR